MLLMEIGAQWNICFWYPIFIANGVGVHRGAFIEFYTIRNRYDNQKARIAGGVQEYRETVR